MSLAARLRRLFRRGGGSTPEPLPLRPGEERVTLSPGWNGPTMETSATYTGRGLNTYRKPTA
ncbi:hypothetical protein MQE23_08470 [Streptomyces sp. HP-A2021]|uniref:hypothetical protein n=1 Tax=Streptomyces sp. HP-A2021 TaxID=2927875 RepID=UPI001FB0043B|nr:hypothetical protein [Streptomyces sp. HP-A2021]UOB09085.1 hypothetical protein MQE23_08470 [Streptomyces sp. HP-A2021]